MTITELYGHIYDLVTLIFTTEGITALVFQSDTSGALPTTEAPYIVVGYTPTTLKKVGNVLSGDITDDIDLGISYLIRQTPYEGEVEVRQVNGDGDLLATIVSQLETVYVTEFLTPLGLTIKDIDLSILSIPFRIDNKVHKESVVSPVFSFYDSRRENLDWIEDVSISGAIESPDGSETTNVDVSNDTP